MSDYFLATSPEDFEEQRSGYNAPTNGTYEWKDIHFDGSGEFGPVVIISMISTDGIDRDVRFPVGKPTASGKMSPTSGWGRLVTRLRELGVDVPRINPGDEDAISAQLQSLCEARYDMENVTIPLNKPLPGINGGPARTQLNYFLPVRVASGNNSDAEAAFLNIIGTKGRTHTEMLKELMNNGTLASNENYHRSVMDQSKYKELEAAGKIVRDGDKFRVA